MGLYFSPTRIRLQRRLKNSMTLGNFKVGHGTVYEGQKMRWGWYGVNQNGWCLFLGNSFKEAMAFIAKVDSTGGASLLSTYKKD